MLRRSVQRFSNEALEAKRRAAERKTQQETKHIFDYVIFGAVVFCAPTIVFFFVDDWIENRYHRWADASAYAAHVEKFKVLQAERGGSAAAS